MLIIILQVELLQVKLYGVSIWCDFGLALHRSIITEPFKVCWQDLKGFDITTLAVT